MPTIIDGTLGLTTPTYGGADTAEYIVPVTAFKNRIINGAMVIDQRNNGASISNTGSTSAGYAVDRFTTLGTQNSRVTMQQNAGSVTSPVGFTRYLGITSSSAYSILSSDWFVTQQRIEGVNTADLMWGTANAQTVTLSFWVRSSLTGTFGGSLKNADSSRSYPFSYTVSSANTWEQKSITIAGDTTGTWVTNTTDYGIAISFGLGVGSTFSGTAGSWQAGNFFSATGATSVVGTNGATFYITGVQLEVGSTATSFDYRPYGTELALCQRYCYGLTSILNATPITTGQAYSTTAAIFGLATPVPMRAIPTLTRNGLSIWNAAANTDLAITALTVSANSLNTVIRLDATVASGLAAGNAAILQGTSPTAGTGSLILSAEL